MLVKFEAHGINGRISVADWKFDPTINLLTGLNGSGKTTILKLLWYLVSGNLERIPQEMTFDYIHLETTEFQITMTHLRETQSVRFLLNMGGTDHPQIMTLDQFRDEGAFLANANRMTAMARQSVFFPTFRRIEGGFSVTRPFASRTDVLYRGAYSNLEQALAQISRQLSVAGHHFVCSISTTDIVNLLTSRYADISQKNNAEQTAFIRSIINEVERQDQLGAGIEKLDDAQLLMSAYSAMNSIRKMATKYDTKQQEVLRPFTTLSKFIENVFSDKGISISGSLELGVGKEKIASELLSAGEKQILSFLVYNAFYDDIPIFIDEPEISLHADWQRILFPTLLEQQTANQFIVATHSPFIYSKYQDKEIPLTRADSRS
jgi:predicted ATPase